MYSIQDDQYQNMQFLDGLTMVMYLKMLPSNDPTTNQQVATSHNQCDAFLVMSARNNNHNQQERSFQTDLATILQHLLLANPRVLYNRNVNPQGD
jgi:hypothetical protein